MGSSAMVPSSTCEITRFTVDGVDGIITTLPDSGSVAVALPRGTPLVSLVPTIEITGVTVSPASGVARDFTSPVNYRVTAEDGSRRDYLVTITFLPVQAATGGTVVLESGAAAGAQVTVPPGALAMDTDITVEDGNIISVDAITVGPPVRFGPSGTQFNPAATVTIPYDPMAVEMGQALMVARRDDLTQEVVLLEAFDAMDAMVSARTSSFSTFQAVTVPQPVIDAFTSNKTDAMNAGDTLTLSWALGANAERVELSVLPDTGVMLGEVVPGEPPITATTTATIAVNPALDPVVYTFTLRAFSAAGAITTATVTVTQGGNEGGGPTPDGMAFIYTGLSGGNLDALRTFDFSGGARTLYWRPRIASGGLEHGEIYLLGVGIDDRIIIKVTSGAIPHAQTGDTYPMVPTPYTSGPPYISVSHAGVVYTPVLEQAESNPNFGYDYHQWVQKYFTGLTGTPNGENDLVQAYPRDRYWYRNRWFNQVPVPAGQPGFSKGAFEIMSEWIDDSVYPPQPRVRRVLMEGFPSYYGVTREGVWYVYTPGSPAEPGCFSSGWCPTGESFPAYTLGLDFITFEP